MANNRNFILLAITEGRNTRKNYCESWIIDRNGSVEVMLERLDSSPEAGGRKGPALRWTGAERTAAENDEIRMIPQSRER
jgi:hypothetical protein